MPLGFRHRLFLALLGLGTLPVAAALLVLAFHYRASVTARTLSDEDVDAVFAWLKGEPDAAPRRPGLLTRTAGKLLIRVVPLPRLTIESRTAEFAGR